MSRINGYAAQNVQPPQVPKANTETPRVKNAGGVADPLSGGTVDGARLSAAGAQVAQATAGSDVRADKVAALQAAIAGGTYKVSASDVADKLLGSLLGER